MNIAMLKNRFLHIPSYLLLKIEGNHVLKSLMSCGKSVVVVFSFSLLALSFSLKYFTAIIIDTMPKKKEGSQISNICIA